MFRCYDPQSVYQDTHTAYKKGFVDIILCPRFGAASGESARVYAALSNLCCSPLSHFIAS